MKLRCSNLGCNSPNIIKDGRYFRPSDGQTIQRYKCTECKKRFSRATFNQAYRQNKRKVNYKLWELLCSGVSLRRAARLLRVHPVTVSRKLRYLGVQKRKEHDLFLKNLGPIYNVQFDDLLTVEHSKCKPLSITLVVEKASRKILGVEVSKMPATGRLAHFAVQKYGKRIDERMIGLDRLFTRMQEVIAQDGVITSDEHPFYPNIVNKYFPSTQHIRVKGARGAITGQGELKKLQYDPLFSLNHTCAMLRANINRLYRRTWCTTKSVERLEDHLYLYIDFHNKRLT